MIRKSFAIIFLLILWLGQVSVSNAQLDSDSILSVNAQYPTVEGQLTHLDSICQLYNDKSYKNGIPLFERRIELLRNHGDFNREANAFESTFYYYYYIAGAVDTARTFAQYYLDKLDQMDDVSNQLTVLYQMSKLTYDEQEYETSIKHAQRAIVLAESSGTELENQNYHLAYRRKGIALSSTGDFNNGFIALNRSKELLIENKDSSELPNVMLDLAVLYSQIGLYEEAEDELTGRYAYGSRPVDRAADKINLARNYIIQGDYSKAHQYYKDALNIGDLGMIDDLYKRYIFNGLVETSHYLGLKDTLNYYFGKLDSIYKRDESKEYFSFLLEQSKFLEALNNNRLPEADRRGTQLINQAKASGDVYDILLYSKFMADLNVAKRDFKEAFEYQEYINQVTDSLTSVNKARGLSLYKTQYETEKKQIEINQLSAAKALSDSRRRLWTIIALLAIGILSVGSLLFYQLRKARNQIQSQNEELKDLNQTKDKFFSIIAHDLRSPLASLQTVDRQMDHYIKQEDLHKLKKVSSLVGKTSRGLGRLLENLLNWALSQTGRIPYHPEKINLKDLFEDTQEELSFPALEKEIDILAELDSNLAIYGDSASVHTIFRNLISNAIKYSHKGDNITVNAVLVDQMVRVLIKDAGVGMSPETLERIFSLDTVSQKGTEGEKGSGLGLMLCKELVQINKGTIRVTSEFGQGTTFIVELPLAA